MISPRPALLAALALAPLACRSPATTAPGAPGSGDVKRTPVREFTFDQEVVVPGDPDAVYDAFTGEISLWWDHTFSGDPASLSLDPRPGGGFVEQFDDAGNGALHATVIHAHRGRQLRMTGPLGLSGIPVDMVHTLDFEGTGDGQTRVRLHLHAMGPFTDELENAVRGVWHHFLVEQFKAYMEARASGPTARAGAEVSLLRQPPHPEPDQVGLGFFSHVGTGARRNHVHADDFRLSSDATVTRVRWWGLSDRGDVLDNFDTFTITIRRASMKGEPGEIVLEQTVPAAGTSATSTGRRGSGKGEASRGREYVHTVPLQSPPTLQAETTYYITVAAHRKDGAADNWQWQDAGPHNRISYSRPLGTPGSTTAWQRIEDADSAFELWGVVNGR